MDLEDCSLRPRVPQELTAIERYGAAKLVMAAPVQILGENLDWKARDHMG